MNCNAIIAGRFYGCSLKSYRLQPVVCSLVMALLVFLVQIGSANPHSLWNDAGFFIYGLWLHISAMFALGVIGYIFYRLFGFQPFISLLHSNSGYDLAVPTPSQMVGNAAPNWLIIPAITVQEAYKRLKTNKILFPHE